MRIEDEIQSTFTSEEHKLIVNLQLTQNRIGENFQNHAKKYGITGTQFNVLRILRGQKGEAVSIGLIKERMLDRNSDMSRIIDRLLIKGLIERKENKDDRRQKDVKISKKGLTLLEKMDKFEQELPSLFKHMKKSEIKELNDLLDKARNTQPKK